MQGHCRHSLHSTNISGSSHVVPIKWNQGQQMCCHNDGNWEPSHGSEAIVQRFYKINNHGYKFCQNPPITAWLQWDFCPEIYCRYGGGLGLRVRSNKPHVCKPTYHLTTVVHCCPIYKVHYKLKTPHTWLKRNSINCAKSRMCLEEEKQRKNYLPLHPHCIKY